MIGKLVPLILAGLGLGGGIAAGLALRPEPEAPAQAGAVADPSATVAATQDATAGDGAEDAPEFARLNNQFVVPVVEEGRVSAMVVLALSLEIEPGMSEAVFQREPKLRDVFLQVLFDHANIGGFSGSFTDSANLVVLRTSLREAATTVLGRTIRDVLITDIARQDG